MITRTIQVMRRMERRKKTKPKRLDRPLLSFYNDISLAIHRLFHACCKRIFLRVQCIPVSAARCLFSHSVGRFSLNLTVFNSGMYVVFVKYTVRRVCQVH